MSTPTGRATLDHLILQGQPHAYDAAVQDDGQRMIEVKDLAQHCLQMLKGKQAETVRRYFFDGQTMDEVGREMGVCKANVASHVKNGCARVRERMGVDITRIHEAKKISAGCGRSLRLPYPDRRGVALAPSSFAASARK